MGKPSEQVKNGKAFEYAILSQYVIYLRSVGVNVSVVENAAYETAKLFFEEQTQEQRERYEESAKATIETIIKLEPGLVSPKNEQDVLLASLAIDSEGRQGDVRDIIFERTHSQWEVGFSAKNNHEAVKHSRLSNQIDFGKLWLGKPCSQQYWNNVLPVFDLILDYKNQGLDWNRVPNKTSDIYLPLLNAFRIEMLRLCQGDSEAPANLVRYLIGKYPIYKIIKEDRYNLVVVKAFNIEGQLNKRLNGATPRYKTPKLNLPHRIVEFELKPGSETTLVMILDEGWEISFRIHNAESRIVPSLKFDIQLLGNPPILFTQHLFQ